MNWQELAATSHYQTAVAIEQELKQGHIAEASEGIYHQMANSAAFAIAQLGDDDS